MSRKEKVIEERGGFEQCSKWSVSASMVWLSLLEGRGDPHTYSAAPAAKAEQQSSSDPALLSARHPLPQLAAPYQN